MFRMNIRMFMENQMVIKFTGTLNFSECYMYCLEKAIKYIIIVLKTILTKEL